MGEPVHAPRRGTLAVLLGAALLLAGGFAALGVWQLQRLAWKEALVARIAERVHAAPRPAPGVAAWPTLDAGAEAYRRVALRGRFDPGRETLVQASTVLGPGHWVLTPLRTEAGFWVLVNRGYVPAERRLPAQRPPTPTGEVLVVGLLRASEPHGRLWQTNDAASGRWYSRDVAAIAAARGLPPGLVAPYFVDVEAATPPAESWPRPGLTVLAFSNNHLGYALTWFALAAMVLGAAGYLLHDARRRSRRAAAPDVRLP